MPSFDINANDLHFICAEDPENCFHAFDDEEEVGDMGDHMAARHPDTWDGKNIKVELVPQCHHCGSPKVRVHTKEPKASFKCHECGIIMAKVMQS